MKTADFQVTSLMHSMAENFIEEGGVCIDATMGSGQDTEFLCRCAGGKGKSSLLIYSRKHWIVRRRDFSEKDMGMSA